MPIVLKPRRVVDLSPEQLLDTLNSTASGDEYIEEELCELYATVVRERRTANVRRRKWLSGTQLLATAGALVILAELIYGLNARL